MTKITVGTTVCYPTGPKRAGKVIAVVLNVDKRPDTVIVKTKDGDVYRERADRVVTCQEDA